MTNPSAVPVDALTALIAERTQYEEWIRALDARRDAVPAHILDRVRGDYTTRLRGVLERLGAHGEDLLTILTDVDTRLSVVEAQLADRQEARLEGELRALVGEYTPDQWESARVGLDGELERLTRERDLLAAERDSLREIYEQVAPAAVPSPDVMEGRGVSDERAGATPSNSGQSPMSIAVDIDVAPSGDRPGAGDPFAIERVDDALVTGDYSARGSDRGSDRGGRAGSSVGASLGGEDTTLDGPGMDPLGELGFLAPLPDPPARTPRRGTPASTSSVRGTSTPADVGAVQGSRAADARPADSAKTLRCQECGAMNYATEWYCERCGGELATL